MGTPFALARALPSPVRARINSRSNSAKPPSTVSISRPCGVVVSAQASASDLKPAPFLAMVSSVLSRSRVDRASLSRRVTISVSFSAFILCERYAQKSRFEMTVYGYARVSTDGQTLAAQEAALHAAGCAKIYAEKVSGAVTDRKAPRRSRP
jgi:hypothetical protein